MVYIIMSDLTCYAWFRTIKPRVKIWCFVFQHVFQYPLPPLCIVSRAEYQSVTTGLVLGWSSRKYHPEAMAFKAARTIFQTRSCYHELLMLSPAIDRKYFERNSFEDNCSSSGVRWWIGCPYKGECVNLLSLALFRNGKGVDWGGGSVKNINVRLFDADRFASDVNRPECQRLEVFHKWGWLHKKGGG